MTTACVPALDWARAQSWNADGSIVWTHEIAYIPRGCTAVPPELAARKSFENYALRPIDSFGVVAAVSSAAVRVGFYSPELPRRWRIRKTLGGLWDADPIGHQPHHLLFRSWRAALDYVQSQLREDSQE